MFLLEAAICESSLSDEVAFRFIPKEILLIKKIALDVTSFIPNLCYILLIPQLVKIFWKVIAIIFLFMHLIQLFCLLHIMIFVFAQTNKKNDIIFVCK